MCLITAPMKFQNLLYNTYNISMKVFYGSVQTLSYVIILDCNINPFCFCVCNALDTYVVTNIKRKWIYIIIGYCFSTCNTYMCRNKYKNRTNLYYKPIFLSFRRIVCYEGFRWFKDGPTQKVSRHDNWIKAYR